MSLESDTNKLITELEVMSKSVQLALATVNKVLENLKARDVKLRRQQIKVVG